MSALKTLQNVINTKLINYNFKWCFVDQMKLPFNYKGNLLKPNDFNDFCEIEQLANENIDNFKGIGLSINASNIVAIDIDKCFSEPFNINSADERAKDILNLFKDYYCEFSFSGTGIRILFYSNLIEDFKDKYYIKNSKNKIEIYFPYFSARYVTITGKFIYNNDINICQDNLLINFLDKYMKRDIKINENLKEDKILSWDEIYIELKKLMVKDSQFLNTWTSKAPGSGKNESELDYFLIISICNNITTNKKLIKEIFETSFYYQSKDNLHKHKWNDTEYFNNTYNRIMRGKR